MPTVHVTENNTFGTKAYVLQPSPHPSRELCKAAIDRAPDGYMVKISPASKTRIQEEKYHAMIGDIANQYKFCGRWWDKDDMKRLLIHQFRSDTKNDPDLVEAWALMGFTEMAPSLDGAGVVMLGVQSRKFPKKLASAFIEWLFAFGASLDQPVRWSEPERWAA